MSEIFKNPMFIAGVVYLLVLPIVLYGLARLQKWMMIDRHMNKPKSKQPRIEDLPKPAWGVWRQRLSFTKGDKRSVTIGKKAVNLERRVLFFILYLLGLALTVIGAGMSNILMITLGIFMFFISIIFGVKSSKALMTERERIMERMLEVGQSKLGLPTDAVINRDVQVLEWKDFTSPQKVKYSVPTNFSDSGAEGFLMQFNQVFGNLQEWVASQEDGGWDYAKGEVTLAAVPPLPTRADWLEHYAIGDGIADSFFPIGLSVTGGVELPNPETGEIENVIGFDLGGKQASVGKEAGLTVDGGLSAASPQLLVAGSTGSGKSLAIDTLVEAYEPIGKSENGDN